MDIHGISTDFTAPSTQKVTQVTRNVEGDKNPNQLSTNFKEANPVITQSEVENQVNGLNQLLEQMGQSITFGVDQNTNSTVVKVVDKNTNELIRQFPSEDALKLMKNLQEYLDRVQQSGSLDKQGLTGSLFNEII